MIKLILVPLDLSDFAEQALPTALMIAKRENADVELVHVYENALPELTGNAPPLDPTLDLELLSRAREELDAIAERAHNMSNVSVRGTVLEGDVEEELASYVERSHADLVVMATHGKGGISFVWLGDVATDLARRSVAPVLLVKPTETGSRTATAKPFSHVLIAIDGSHLAEEAIEHAVTVAGRNDVEYLLVRVLPPYKNVADLVESEEDERRHKAKAYLDEVVKRYRSLGISMAGRLRFEDNVARAILDTADDISAHLIAMETHGAGGLKRIFMGSVADKVLRASNVPMLLHRPKVEEKAHAGHESEGSAARGSRRS